MLFLRLCSQMGDVLSANQHYRSCYIKYSISYFFPDMQIKLVIILYRFHMTDIFHEKSIFTIIFSQNPNSQQKHNVIAAERAKHQNKAWGVKKRGWRGEECGRWLTVSEFWQEHSIERGLTLLPLAQSIFVAIIPISCHTWPHFSSLAN